jgi:translocation and assembly module TamB
LADATVEATLRPGLPLMRSWPLAFESANVRAALSGAWTNLRHRGTFAVSGLNLKTEVLRAGAPAPLRTSVYELKELQLAGSWDGAHAARITAQLEATTAAGGVALGGTLEDLREFALASLSLRAGDEPPLVLREPARMRFRAAAATGGPAWSFEISRLTLANEQRHLAFEGALAWPDGVRASLAATNLDSRLPGAFLKRPLPKATLESLAAELDGAQGPARFRLAASGWLEAATNWVVQARTSLEGDERGLRVAELRLFERDAEALRLSGNVPFVCGLLGPGRFWDLRPDQPLALDFHLASTPALQRIGLGRLGLLATNLHGHGTLTGTLAAPNGQVRVLADGVEPIEGSPLAGRLPRLENLELNLRADTSVLRLEPLRLRVEGTPIEVAAALPHTAAFREGISSGAFRPDLSGLSAWLRLDPLPLADLTARLPPVLRSEGGLSADLRLEPGWRWAGRVEIAGLATRPLPQVGPLRNVHGRLVLQDREARLEGFSVDVGGATARLEGRVALPAGPPAGWQLPAFDLRLTGQEIPLVRDTELIVRGDLDLRLEHAATHAPLLAGTVTLGRSFVLSDLPAVIGVGVRRAMRPPPFFSVAAEPFARWRLGVDIRGDECLHVRGPFYTGAHSVNVKLRGTLREPVLLGDAQVARANVVFPYAVLPVRQGIVSFSAEDPARPRLQAQAAGRAFGYDLRLEATGTLDEPVIRFSSSPPLNSEDILLMVSAGELPRHSMDHTTADRLAKFAFILGKDLMRKLGAAEPGEERLTFRTGERISARGKVTRHLELRLTDAWSLVGEYDEYDELNAGVKWRVLRR